MFLETSAKTGHSVEEAFLKCSKNILAKIETGELDPERIGSGTVKIFCTVFTVLCCTGIQYGESLLRRTDQLSATRRTPDCSGVRSSCKI